MEGTVKGEMVQWYEMNWSYEANWNGTLQNPGASNSAFNSSTAIYRLTGDMVWVLTRKDTLHIRMEILLLKH